jgi:NAD(P)-dependent dehydrogenase (short-subunit alcohol dehydrogenase family)
MSELRFEGRVIVVTGAGEGLGRAHALLLAKRGAKVVVNDIGTGTDGVGRSNAPAEKVVAEIQAAGGTAVPNFSSVATEEGAKAIIQTAIDSFGRVDAVIHNAGVATFIPFGEMSYQDYRTIVSVHADGGFLISRAAWPHMVRQKYGRFLMITSQAALLGIPHLAHYAVAKTGLVGLARMLAIEGEEHNIRANALGVAAYTRAIQEVFRHLKSPLPAAAEEFYRKYMRPEIVSPVAAYLVHHDCAITGQILDSAAGHVCHQFLGMTEGYTNLNLTPEAVRDHLEEITNVSRGYRTFANATECNDWRSKKMIAASADPVPL